MPKKARSTHPAPKAANIGARLRLAAMRYGGSQADLARYCGVSRTAVTKWRAGAATDLSASNVFAVARACGVNAEWLATGKAAKGKPSPAAPSNLAELDSATIAVASAAKKLPPKARRALRMFLASLAPTNRRKPDKT